MTSLLDDVSDPVFMAPGQSIIGNLTIEIHFGRIVSCDDRIDGSIHIQYRMGNSANFAEDKRHNPAGLADNEVSGLMSKAVHLNLLIIIEPIPQLPIRIRGVNSPMHGTKGAGAVANRYLIQSVLGLELIADVAAVASAFDNSWVAHVMTLWVARFGSECRLNLLLPQ